MKETPFPSQSSIETSSNSAPERKEKNKKCFICNKREGTNQYLGENICSYYKISNSNSTQRAF
jgi:hypothetical protein